MSSLESTKTRRRTEGGLTRRHLLAYGLGNAATWALGPRPATARQALPIADVGHWRTWLLASSAEFRPPAPAEPQQVEIDELLALQDQRTDATHEAIARWGTGPAVLPWTDLTLALIKEFKPNPPRAARALALLHVAADDAVVVTWDARAASSRPAPASAIAYLTPVAADEAAGTSSFPSEHAAVAGAATTVLTALFPDAAARLAPLAEEATTSRLWAGANYRSDLEAGLAIGQAVGRLAVVRAESDGANAVWDGTRPSGKGVWQPTPPDFRADPVEPLGGTWRTWVLPGGDFMRPVAPPTWGSEAWRAELLAVQEAVARRTPKQAEAALLWAGGPGSVTPPGLWIEIARDLIARDGLDLPHAARALALTSVAMADGFVCCWDAKYAYWSARPVTADPTLDVLFPTPPFPSYTSGHSTISAAAATVLGHLFPGDADDLTDKAREAKDSRLWAGIHFPIDNDMGATGGALVGRLVVAHAHADGAEPSNGG